VKILVDMNLSPAWIAVFTREDWHALHWSEIGNPNAPDDEILEWAGSKGYVIFTHDLDFGTLLASKRRHAPSVVQLGSQEVTPSRMGDLVVRAFRQLSAELQRGALVTIDPLKTRARLLPLR
jgi:predicted nuclease of predicted toxin-antitoxin system